MTTPSETTIDPKLIAYVEKLRHACATNGPCSDNGDGCTCSAEELDRRWHSHPSETRDSALVASDRLREILAGCEGVTAGPWRFSGTRMGGDASITTDLELIASVRPKSLRAFDPEGDAKRDAIADHIARLDPQTVASIITELLALREAADTIDRLTSTGEAAAWRYRNRKAFGENVGWGVSASRPDAGPDWEVQPLYVSPREGHVEVPLEPGLSEAFTALDLADSLIERAYGVDTPKEWHRAYRKVAKARAALPHNQGETKP